MLFESVNQSLVFLIMAYFGILAGLVDELPRLLCARRKLRRWLLITVDILRMLSFFALVFLGGYIANFGEFRIFSFLGAGLGFFAERKLLSKGFTQFLLATHRLLIRFLKAIFKRTPTEKNLEPEGKK